MLEQITVSKDLEDGKWKYIVRGINGFPILTSKPYPNMLSAEKGLVALARTLKTVDSYFSKSKSKLGIKNVKKEFSAIHKKPKKAVAVAVGETSESFLDHLE